MTAETAQSGSSPDFISIGIIFIAVALLIGTIVVIRRKIQEQEYLNQLEEANFERSILSELGNLSSDSIFEVPSSEAFPLPIPPDDIVKEVVPAEISTLPVQTAESPLPSQDSPTSSEFRIDIAAKKVINQLVAANLTDGLFDFVNLHGNPQYALYIKLKSEKLVLILPAPESEAFVRQQSKRYDHIIVLDRNGNGLITTTLENFISDKIRF